MKTANKPSFACGVLALFVLLPLGAMAAETTGAATNESSEAQTHVLFTGANIGIVYDGKVHPVEDVDGTSLAISVEDRKGLGLPRDYRNKKLMVTRVQNVTDRSVTVANFKHERAYTKARDPYRKASEDILNALAMQTTARRLEEQARKEPATIQAFRGGMAPTTIDNPLKASLDQLSHMAQSVVSSDLGNPGQIAGNMAEEQARAEFDALEAEFELSSPTPIQRPYVVVMANYHTKETPNESQIWVAAKSVDVIDSTPRKVWLLEGGLPPGYILEDVRLHVYKRGTEIATNLSENRAALTRDEAHEYLVLDHTTVHKSDTLPAWLVLTQVPADWTTRPRDNAFLKTYYLKVDQTGRPVDAFEDEACKTKVADAYCDAVLRDQLFLPALVKGSPVESVVRMKLTNLAL